MIDFAVADEGTLVLFRPMNPEAEEVASVWFQAAPRFGSAYCVQSRFAEEIIEDLEAHGYALAETTDV